MIICYFDLCSFEKTPPQLLLLKFDIGYLICWLVGATGNVTGLFFPLRDAFIVVLRVEAAAAMAMNNCGLLNKDIRLLALPWLLTAVLAWWLGWLLWENKEADRAAMAACWLNKGFNWLGSDCARLVALFVEEMGYSSRLLWLELLKSDSLDEEDGDEIGLETSLLLDILNLLRDAEFGGLVLAGFIRFSSACLGEAKSTGFGVNRCGVLSLLEVVGLFSAGCWPSRFFMLNLSSWCLCCICCCWVLRNWEELTNFCCCLNRFWARFSASVSTETSLRFRLLLACCCRKARLFSWLVGSRVLSRKVLGSITEAAGFRFMWLLMLLLGRDG